jgi:phytoene dehydrogenase-like protein
MADYDVITIGAGHNGLITSAYLAQAGYRVAVFERRSIVGGAVSTQEVVPGYRFDLGGSAHILIRLTPIVEELGLHEFGLDYLELDPLFFAPFPDGDSFYMYRDVDKTCDQLERKYPGEGEAYRRFVDDWRPFSTAVREVFLSTPSPLQIGKHFMKARSRVIDWRKQLSSILKPYGEVVRDYFTEPKIQSALAWMAAQSGPPPTEPLTGPFVLWHPLYHDGGIARPRGGSGMLTVALRRQIEAHGGHVFTDAPVSEILMQGRRAVGVRAGADTHTSRVIVGAGHVVEILGRLLPEEHRPAELLRNVRVGNGFGVMLRLALDDHVRYAADSSDDARIALQLICPGIDSIESAYGDYLKKRPTENPPIVAMTFSAVDDTLAPPDGEVLWLWAQYYPYELSGGLTWETIKDEVRDSILRTFDKYAPGTSEAVVGELFQHPEWLERELGLLRGNVMHLEMSLDQMFMLRPSVRMSGYRAHIKGLYLTGASTHPGGGIMGASGRNAARVILKDL